MSVLPRHSHWPTRLDRRPKRILIEAERLAHFARSGLAAIRDDVRGHGRAKFAVALVDILDGLLAFFFGRKIEIDVRPFTAAFGQKALEEQLHADRIDGRDFERIADGRVGCAAAALNQNVRSACSIRTMSQTMRKYPAKPSLAISASSCSTCFFARSNKLPIILWTIAALDSFRDALQQKAVHRLSIRHRIARKLISEVVQFEFETRRESSTVFSMAPGTSRKSAAISAAARR